VVSRAAAEVARRADEGGLSAPSVRSIFLGGIPGFLREGFLPLGAFYVGLRLGGLGAGMAAAAAASVLVYLWERRAGRDGLLVRLSLAFVAVQTVVGVVSQSTTAYLATPVLANAVWGAAFLVSAALRRPLAGALACAWYPFPRAFRQTDEFKRVYGVESIVWGLYLLLRSALRIGALLEGGVEGFLVVTFLTGTPTMLALLAWSVWYAVRRFSRDEEGLARTGPRRDRVRIWALRTLGVAAWRLGARLGVDIARATEGPPIVLDRARREAFERLIAAARAGNGTVDVDACPYPVHELLAYLVHEHGLLLHGSNKAALELLEPRPARDWTTELCAVVACDDGIWPLFYAVVARDRVDGVFSACIHLGRPPRLRRFYMFAVGGDPTAPATWTEGAVYALPRDGFRREWDNEWVTSRPVRPVLCVPVPPEDFPLRHAVRSRVRAAKRERAAPPEAAPARPRASRP
jgi:hypothetical protein